MTTSNQCSAQDEADTSSGITWTRASPGHNRRIENWLLGSFVPIIHRDYQANLRNKSGLGMARSEDGGSEREIGIRTMSK